MRLCGKSIVHKSSSVKELRLINAAQSLNALPYTRDGGSRRYYFAFQLPKTLPRSLRVKWGRGSNGKPSASYSGGNGGNCACKIWYYLELCKPNAANLGRFDVQILQAPQHAPSEPPKSRFSLANAGGHDAFTDNYDVRFLDSKPQNDETKHGIFVSTRLESTIVQAGGKLVVTVTVDNKSGFPLPQIDVKVIETMNAAIKDSTMNKMGAMQEPPGLKCVGQAAFGPVGASERRSEAVALRLSGAGDVWGTTLLTEGHDWDRFAFAVDYRVEVDVWKHADTGWCV